MSLNEAKTKVKDLVIDIVVKHKDEVINQLVEQKQAMFDDNTHNWEPLLPQTIERKQREKELFIKPESINIRKGDLFNTFNNPNKYKVTKSSSNIDFDIELNNFQKEKADIVAIHKRAVLAINLSELEQVADKLTQLIVQKLKQNRNFAND